MTTEKREKLNIVPFFICIKDKEGYLYPIDLFSPRFDIETNTALFKLDERIVINATEYIISKDIYDKPVLIDISTDEHIYYLGLICDNVKVAYIPVINDITSEMNGYYNCNNWIGIKVEKV